ncbi:MAG: LLM class flavin-dependent oxidoreductase [Acidimicrobiia bacterium]|nr:LLM class flavin-dependent oxidoreductase [Acidimicrobiia bacterium]
MRIGIQLPEVERRVSWLEMREIAQMAEGVGFDSIWVGDHLLYRDDSGSTGPWEAWSVLAGLAEATERVMLGPLVAATAFHNPAMLAKKAATVDEISGGRLVLGIGAGWNQVEFDAYGFPFDRRASRFEEAFTILRTLIRDGAIDFEGTFYTLRDCELIPPARPDLPIMIGSQGPRVLRATLAHVDAWNGWYAWYGNTAEGASGLLSTLDEACRDVGRDPATVERTVTVLVEAPGATGNQTRAARWQDPPAVGGSPEEIAASLSAFGDIGIDEVQLVVDPITEASVRWLGDVLPIVHG